MTREEAKSCIGTIELLQRLAYNIHGVMDVIDADNCKKIIKALEQEPCEDCVSREKVWYMITGGKYSDEDYEQFIDRLVNELSKMPSVTPQVDYKAQYERLSQKAEIVISQLRADRDRLMSLVSVTPQEAKWIPVSERLPTKEEYIANNGLFIVSDGNRTYAEYFDVYSSMKYFGEPAMNGFRVDRCVTAWMPVPEPYKAESEDNK